MYRKYEAYNRLECIQIILTEIAGMGKSTGWGGTSESLEIMKKELGKFNVIYSNDFYGEWKLKTVN